MAVGAYLLPRVRGLYSSFFGRFWMRFVLDSDTRAADDFDDRFVSLVRSVIPEYNLPTAFDPQAGIAAAESAAEAVAVALKERNAGDAAPAATSGGDGAGPSTALPTSALGSSTMESLRSLEALRSYFDTLYDTRAKWAGTYVRSSLLLTVLTTGRAESWHNVLKTALNFSGNTTLENLIISHNKVLDDLWAKIKIPDGGSTRSHRLAGVNNLVVIGARAALSSFAADVVAKESDYAQKYDVQQGIEQDGGRIVYMVLRPSADLRDEEEGPTGTEKCRKDRVVVVHRSSVEGCMSTTRMECSCQMLTSVGLPCRHMLAVLVVRQEARALHPYLYHPRWALDGPQDADLLAALATRVAATRVALQEGTAAGPSRAGRAGVVTEVILLLLFLDRQ